MESLSPVMFVDEVEPCLDFWGRLGFEVVDTVPHGDVLGFAMLKHGGVVVMLQSRASLADDMPAVNELVRGHNLGLFLRVASLVGSPSPSRSAWPSELGRPWVGAR
jgi:hypothetical protein